MRISRSRLNRGGWPRYSRRHSSRSCWAVSSFKAAIRWDSSFCPIGFAAAVVAVSRAGNCLRLRAVFMGDLRCFCTHMGASTTSSPGKAGLTSIDTSQQSCLFRMHALRGQEVQSKIGGEVILGQPGRFAFPQRRRGSLITVWLEVRILPGPPPTPVRTDGSRSLTNRPRFAGFSAVQTRGVWSLCYVKSRYRRFSPPGLWAPQTRSWRRPELQRLGSNR